MQPTRFAAVPTFSDKEGRPKFKIQTLEQKANTIGLLGEKEFGEHVMMMSCYPIWGGGIYSWADAV